MAVTIREVAEAAGVSTATVSRALRGLPYVDEATRLRVLAAAASLDYVVSPSASRLASGRAGSIAVVTPFIARWFFSTVLSGVEQVTHDAGLDLLLLGVGDPDRPSDVPTEQRLRQRADGAIIVALPADDPEVKALLHANLPVSIVGSLVPDVPCVAIDDAEAAHTATEHLLNLGHRRIGVISGSRTGSVYTTQEHRYRGYCDALMGAGITPDPGLVTYGQFTREGGERAMLELLAHTRRPTAVFCMSDEMAFGASVALRRQGLIAGVDISLIGIDGHPQAEVIDLTTVEQPVESMGRFAAESLLAVLGITRAPERAAGLVPTRLVVRGSTASPREGR